MLLLSPFAPHMAEELWQALGHADTLAYEPWPKFDPALAREDTIEIPVQVNGKLRSKVAVAGRRRREGARSGRPRRRPRSPSCSPAKQVVKDGRRAGPAGEFCRCKRSRLASS